jgi:amino-acid N-acetyltransferase
MRPDYALRELSQEQLLEVDLLLKGAGLPRDDIREPGRHFYRLEDAAGPVAWAGLEPYGIDGLLRSIIVLEHVRGRANGSMLVEATIAEARRLGVERLWLLTTTAAGFFARIGFREVPRDAAPPPIAATTEFASLCPASATCMMFEIKKGQLQ